MKRFIRKLFVPRPAFEPQSYEALKHNRHVFVFGVWGRTSTTAFQRIMNSTRGLCVWGEPGEYLVDNFMDAYLQLVRRMEDPVTGDRIQMLPDAFRRNDYSVNPAMALGDWTSGTRHLEQAFVDLLLPAIPVQRLSFKEIRVRSHRTFDGLRRMFPNCQFVHLFRDPLAQWPSVQTMPWKESQSVELFIERVEELGNLYLKYDGVFVEDKHLGSRPHLDRLTQHLGVSNYSPDLIGDGVFAAKVKQPVPPEVARLIEERLGDVYARLRRRSAEFFGPLV